MRSRRPGSRPSYVAPIATRGTVSFVKDAAFVAIAGLSPLSTLACPETADLLLGEDGPLDVGDLGHVRQGQRRVAAQEADIEPGQTAIAAAPDDAFDAEIERGLKILPG